MSGLSILSALVPSVTAENKEDDAARPLDFTPIKSLEQAAAAKDAGLFGQLLMAAEGNQDARTQAALFHAGQLQLVSGVPDTKAGDNGNASPLVELLDISEAGELSLPAAPVEIQVPIVDRAELALPVVTAETDIAAIPLTQNITEFEGFFAGQPPVPQALPVVDASAPEPFQEIPVPWLAQPAASFEGEAISPEETPAVAASVAEVLAVAQDDVAAVVAVVAGAPLPVAVKKTLPEMQDAVAAHEEDAVATEDQDPFAAPLPVVEWAQASPGQTISEAAKALVAKETQAGPPVQVPASEAANLHAKEGAPPALAPSSADEKTIKLPIAEQPHGNAPQEFAETLHQAVADTGRASAPARQEQALAPFVRPAHEAPPVQDQVHVQVKQALGEGSDRVVIRLSPPELGSLDIRMQVGRDGQTQVAIVADNKDTLDLLQRDARGLERALQDAGLKTDAGSMSFNLRQDQNFGGQNGQAEGQSEFSGPVTPGDTALAPSETEAALDEMTANYQVTVTSGLDIRV